MSGTVLTLCFIAVFACGMLIGAKIEEVSSGSAIGAALGILFIVALFALCLHFF